MTNPSAPPSTASLWAGRLLTAIPAAMLLLSGTMKLLQPAAIVDTMQNKFGLPPSLLVPLGLLEISCTLLYLVPRTAVLGAILVTGYLGGAVATHTRLLDPAGVTPLLLGVFAWGGLYFRDARVRALLPLRAEG